MGLKMLEYNMRTTPNHRRNSSNQDSKSPKKKSIGMFKFKLDVDEDELLR